MKITPGHVILPLIIIVVGGVLCFLGFSGGWGAVWAAAGGFFITTGLGAILITLAWIAPGKLGTLLKHPLVSILILGSMLGMMCFTLYLGVFK